ncbi:MAG: ATP synthase F1 subunit gamma [Bacteroidales bacterium]|nr:ATP synthase F1 subunit gamma [Bacteroidales bacterium]MDD3890694.1 ATP synthase F1 subunit gamma [Bacteroidales bacterium]
MIGLRDIRNRINSIASTQKITGAMKMISAAKFHKAHDSLFRYKTYSNKILDILHQISPTINEDEANLSKWFTKPSTLSRIALVVITSNSSLCGAFNQNLIKKIMEDNPPEFGENWGEITEFYCLGKKGDDFFRKKGYNVISKDTDIANNPDYKSSSEFVQMLIRKYLEQKYDAVYVAFNEFKNPAVQTPTIKQILPFVAPVDKIVAPVEQDVIFEPTKEYIMGQLIPLALETFFYEMLLENAVGEHGARMTSMHQATENAIEINKDLKLLYNKARQAAITNEILEIVSGAEALKG